VLLALTGSNEVIYAGRSIGLNGIEPLLKRLLNDGHINVVVQTDDDAAPETLVRVIDACKHSGVENVSIASRDADAAADVEPPVAIYQPSPCLTAELRQRIPATVHISFLVNDKGHVEEVQVQRTSDPAFDAIVLDAVRQWRFLPARRDGKTMPYRMTLPVHFPRELRVNAESLTLPSPNQYRSTSGDPAEACCLIRGIRR
jgi:TonB family protein